MSDFNDIIGLTPEQAEEKLKDRGITRVRVMQRDGEHLVGTMDYRTDRLSVATEDGVITGIFRIG